MTSGPHASRSRLATGRGRTLPPFACMRRAVTVLAATGLALLVALTATPPATAMTAPDSAGLARMRDAAVNMNRFRIVTDRAQYFADALRADEDGIVLVQQQRRTALIVGPGGDVNPGKRASWAEIERVDGMRAHGLRNGVEGAVIGTLIGAGVAAAIRPQLHDAEAAAVIVIPFSTAIGALVGALSGSATGWKPLAP